jgi:hypothetical protein
MAVHKVEILIENKSGSAREAARTVAGEIASALSHIEFLSEYELQHVPNSFKVNGRLQRSHERVLAKRRDETLSARQREAKRESDWIIRKCKEARRRQREG